MKNQKTTKKPKTLSCQDSAVIMTQLVLPSHTNALGTIFGGTVMAWIDIAAAISAQKHSRSAVVTASIDALHFLSPIQLGHVVHLKASVNFCGRTSMEVGVRVDSENPLTGEKWHSASAYTTFVAIDQNNNPIEVPRLFPKTATEKRRHQSALARRASRKKLADKIKQKDRK